jgi:heterogeneous nuclear ribonucleoprotein U-like protein 1
MDSDPVTLSFSKNGNDLGVCFEVEKEKLEDRALFPHILTKNTEYELNFGTKVMQKMTS